MKQIHKYTHKRAKGVFSGIKGDKSLFAKIIDDMKTNAGDFSPRLNWHLVEKTEEDRFHQDAQASDRIYARYDDKAYQNRHSSSEKILDVWIGSKGMQTIDRDTIEHYSDFLEAVDFLGLWPTFIEQHDQFDYKVTDLGSIIDVNLISGLIEPDIEKLHILEVGGGYGRLAEAFLNVYKDQVKYVMLDSVPASLMFAYLYLKTNYPDLKIGYYYHDDEFDMQQFDVYIMPSWHFDRLNRIHYDVAVNIESMQEMLQWHVDYYIDLFNRLTKDKGLIYISNSRDYVFQGDWNYPDNWERLMAFNTPRSWTHHHPTEIFRKTTNGAHKLKNQFVAAGYHQHLSQELSRQAKIETQDRQLTKLRSSKLIKLIKIKFQNYRFALYLEKRKKN